MSFISSFEIIKVVVLESCFFLNPASIAEAAAAISNGAKIFLPTELLLSLMDLLIYLVMSLKILQTVSFDFSKRVYSLIFVSSSPPATP